MATRTTSFTQTIDGTTQTSDTLDPLKAGQAASGFAFGISGTFVGACRLQRSLDGGSTWIDFLVLDQPDILPIPDQEEALWRASWAGAGDYTSGSAVVTFYMGNKDASAHFQRLATKDRRLVGDDNPLQVGNAQNVSLTVLIANGTSLSAAIDCIKARLAAIYIPSAWTAAGLTFQTSADGVTWNNRMDRFLTEYTVGVSGPSVSIQIPLTDFIDVRYLKIRSGTSASPVNQGADRSLTVVLVR
ncbi:hypothetical protein [Nitrobacter sp.]|uniref:hypothetical protein n=1 Tax=Nitrobacter sp. TaxID=29420 RepID=UPI0029CAAC6E|nr:hypothetical protein [Nitrobacter sp.]